MGEREHWGMEEQTMIDDSVSECKRGGNETQTPGHQQRGRRRGKGFLKEEIKEGREGGRGTGRCTLQHHPPILHPHEVPLLVSIRVSAEF